jgi:hypothetical protein
VAAYYDVVSNTLVLAVYPNSDPTRVTTKVVDATPQHGRGVSLAVLSNTAVVMSYSGAVGQLKIARCSLPCVSPVIATITDTENGASFGLQTALRLTKSGTAVVAHSDTEGTGLFLTTCEDTLCSRSQTQRVARSVAYGTDIGLALTTTDSPVLAYAEPVESAPDTSTLRLLTCGDSACTSRTNVIIDATADAGYGVSLILGPNNEAHLSYIARDQWAFRYARCSNAACTAVTIRSTDSFALTGSDTAIALHTNAKGRLQPIFLVNHARAVLGSTNVTLVSCATTECATVTKNVIAGADSDIGMSLRHTGNLTVVAYYFLGGDVYTYNDPAFPLATSTSRSTQRIAVGALPDKFSKTSPSQYTPYTPGQTFTLRWGSSVNADTYEYCVYRKSETCTNWIAASTGTFRPNSSWGEYSYSWQVRAVNRVGSTLADNGTPWEIYYATRTATRTTSPTLTRTATPTPVVHPAFVKTAPANNAVNVNKTVTLRWGTIRGAVSYAYCLSTALTCTKWVSVGTAQSATPAELAALRTYYWQVRATDRFGTVTVASGGYWKFTTRR